MAWHDVRQVGNLYCCWAAGLVAGGDFRVAGWSRGTSDGEGDHLDGNNQRVTSTVGASRWGHQTCCSVAIPAIIGVMVPSTENV